jgi:hypothetical protein
VTFLELRDAARVDVVAWWHRVWPLAGSAIALIVNVACVGFLGYALAKAIL